MGKNVSKWSQLLEGESYSVHIGSSFLFCAGLAYVADQYAARSSHMPVISLLKIAAPTWQLWCVVHIC